MVARTFTILSCLAVGIIEIEGVIRPMGSARTGSLGSSTAITDNRVHKGLGDLAIQARQMDVEPSPQETSTFDCHGGTMNS